VSPTADFASHRSENKEDQADYEKDDSNRRENADLHQQTDDDQNDTESNQEISPILKGQPEAAIDPKDTL